MKESSGTCKKTAVKPNAGIVRRETKQFPEKYKAITLLCLYYIRRLSMEINTNFYQKQVGEGLLFPGGVYTSKLQKT